MLAIATLFCMTSLLAILFRQYRESNHYMGWRLHQAPHSSYVDLETPVCSKCRNLVSGDLWEKSRRRYAHLRDDKFTLVVQTYKRPYNLNKTLNIILGERVPALHEVVVVWNDVNATAPEDFISVYNVPVRFRVSPHNSLNMKLWADPEYHTQAVLLSDDDCHYEPSDLDFVFSHWRYRAKDRIVGAFPRCVNTNADGQYEYDFCGNHDRYSMILTGLAFAHVSFLDYFSSEDPLMTKIRALIDKRFNCEDIALNFMVSMLTCNSPLQVSGLEDPVNEGPKDGISTKPGHLTKRNECINDFYKLIGYMPLQDSTYYVRQGSLE
ncbi:Glyco-transf-64 domain-containing protein [Fusarium sp. LHS14.1]|nr:Glyco-transf-64 domain-containing protein [Fusarium sp. LHS14.1]